MGRVINDQVIASTSLDRQGERIPPETLVHLFRQLQERGLPPAVNHDLTGTPIARSSNPRLRKLDNDELAIVVDLEVINEEEFTKMGGFSIAFLRKTVRFGEGEPIIAVLINPVQFDFEQAVDRVKRSIPDTYTFDVTERVEKGAEIATAIITVILTVASKMALKMAEGFLSAVGESLLNVLIKLRRKDVPDGPRKFQLCLNVPNDSQGVHIILELESPSTEISGVSLAKLMKAVEHLPRFKEAQRVVGWVKPDGTVVFCKIILMDNTAFGVEVTVPRERQPTLPSIGREPQSDSAADLVEPNEVGDALLGRAIAPSTLRNLQIEILQAGKNRDRRREAWLLELAESHESNSIRRSAIVSLRRLGSRKVWPLLVSILSSERSNQNLRETAIKTLGEVGTAEILPILRRIAYAGDIANLGQLAAKRAIRRLESRLESEPAAAIPDENKSGYRDVFLCHASEDKSQIVAPLSAALEREGISCWYDEAEILWGDSITDKVNDGLRVSRYVVAVLTTAFLKKNWPQRELNAILNLEATTGLIRILVLLAGEAAEKDRILRQFPLLSDKLYLDWLGHPGPVVTALRKRLSSNPTFLASPAGEERGHQPSQTSGVLTLAENLESRKEIFVRRPKCQDAQRYLEGIAHTIGRMANSIAAGSVPHAELGAIRTHARLLPNALNSSLTLMEAGELITELERISDASTLSLQDSATRMALIEDLRRLAGVFEALGSACGVNYDIHSATVSGQL